MKLSTIDPLSREGNGRWLGFFAWVPPLGRSGNDQNRSKSFKIMRKPSESFKFTSKPSQTLKITPNHMKLSTIDPNLPKSIEIGVVLSCPTVIFIGKTSEKQHFLDVAFCRHFGTPFGPHGRCWSHLWTILEPYEAILVFLGAILEPSWAILGPLGASMWPFWTLLLPM